MRFRLETLPSPNSLQRGSRHIYLAGPKHTEGITYLVNPAPGEGGGSLISRRKWTDGHEARSFHILYVRKVMALLPEGEEHPLLHSDQKQLLQ